MKALIRVWPREKIERFQKLWNEGIEGDGLTERFGVRSALVVRQLRAAGYALTPRRTSDMLSRDKIKRPEDTRAQWFRRGAQA